MSSNISSKLRKALSALAQGRLEEALPTLREEAAAGVPEAQFTLGSLYANGEGVELDYVRAAELIRGAAEQGLGAAQPVLAWMYANGYGVEQDNAAARAWSVRAAESGEPDAQFSAALMYHFGRFGAERDPHSAVRWYAEAARHGHVKAQFALGKLCAEGELVPADDEAAFQWLTLAIMGGSEPAKKELAMLTGRLRPEQIEAFKQRMMERVGGTAPV